MSALRAAIGFCCAVATDVLAAVDKPLTIVLKPLGEGKIRVRTSSWDQKHVILADQVLEAVAWANHFAWCAAVAGVYEPTRLADADCGPAG
jgi:hypothetical protein